MFRIINSIYWWYYSNFVSKWNCASCHWRDKEYDTVHGSVWCTFESKPMWGHSGCAHHQNHPDNKGL